MNSLTSPYILDNLKKGKEINRNLKELKKPRQVIRYTVLFRSNSSEEFNNKKRLFRYYTNHGISI